MATTPPKLGQTINDLPLVTGTLTGNEPIETVFGSKSFRTTVGQIAEYAKLPTLLGWAYTQSFQLVTSTRDANGAIISADIVWPDGVTGTFTTDTTSTAFPGAIDAWHATYAGTPTKLITQPAVTRDVNGAVTAQPAITIV
jgi:hypothetical protein